MKIEMGLTSSGSQTATGKVSCYMSRACTPDDVGQWTIERIRFDESDHSHEIVIRAKKRPREILSPDLCDLFEEHLPNEPVTSVFYGKLTKLEKPNLFVNGVKITAFKVLNGIQRCLVIFDNFSGSALLALTPSSWCGAAIDIKNHLIASMIENVLTPVLNIASLESRSPLDDTALFLIANRIERIRSQKNQISTCIAALRGCLGGAEQTETSWSAQELKPPNHKDLPANLHT